MQKKKFPIIDELSGNATIKIKPQVKELHPITEQLIVGLSQLEFINFINISEEDLQASRELTQGQVKIPISEPNHPSASGVHLIIHYDFNDIQFYEINSTVKGNGGKMFGAIMKTLPDNWRAIVVMDWSQGFWEKMIEKYDNLERL